MISIFLLKYLVHALALQPPTPVENRRSKFVSKKFSVLRQGGVYVHPNWLLPREVKLLRDDIADLRQGKKFKPSGLSNRVDGDTNSFGDKDRSTCTITPDLKGDVASRKAVEKKLDSLRLALMDDLDIGTLEFAEHYYSFSPTGSFLPRHMDERHEETKGEKAWETETRRSISWLLYLNGPDWQSGGEFRAYCRLSTSICGAHEGNLQVGWLPNHECSNIERSLFDEDLLFDPIFLDSWVKAPAKQEDGDTSDELIGSLLWRPLSALYRLTKSGRRDYISAPFGPDTPTWPSDINLEPDQFAVALANQVDSNIGPLIGVESIANVQPVDILPTGGTLVLFDSATVPHEVLETTNSMERCAMAGWFHEPVQEFPDWYGT